MITLFCIKPKGFNVGNEAIYLGMQYYLYEAFGEIVNIITLPATARYETSNIAGLTSRTIYSINQYGHGVIIGGGNLYENGELDIDEDALKALDVPLMLFSLSRGRVYNRHEELVNRTDALPDRIIKALNDNSDYSLSRDNATHEYLNGIGCDKSLVGGCPTIFLERISNRLPKLPNQEKGGALISIRNPELMNVPLHRKAQVYGNILKIVEFLKDKGLKKIRLLCHDHRDIGFAASFQGLDYVYTGDVYSYLALLRSSELNISYRLHSTLPCLSYGIPVINMSYDERAVSLIDSIGLDEWNINMFETDDELSQVVNRYQRLNELPIFKEKARNLWNKMDEVMLDTFKSFANDVHQKNHISY
jgi:polysaccharide pyruvyl transferase WcaK-like protein